MIRSEPSRHAPRAALQDIRLRPRGKRSMGGPRPVERSGNRLRLRPSRQNLWAAGLLLFGLLCALGLRHALQWVAHQPMFDLRQVRVQGELEQVDPDLIRKRALALHGNFFTLDLAAASNELRTVSWVRAVAIRRIWPDGLEVEVEEQHPVARWGEDELINTQGERFTAEFAGVLPYFQGPQGSEALMLEAYRGFRAQMAAVPLAITDLELSDRGAWRLTADNGLEVALGREDIHDRLARFIQVYPQLVKVTSPAGAVADLRYTHGFALRNGSAAKDPNT